ncbi:hypothetical protein [Sphingomonas sp.]|jgi:hypothetical protein|uniref:hypothetical protein n=1 Tax=Sphingomonas sp. TaxID=28214 RepID=UPI002E36513B|nr:hypothetical protein [Sphingomonas sp.]HEX4693399.1 hypothetical protein [Sphingomonas sp.]
MKDRQFTIVLALVVAAGLVMGLVAFRMTGGATNADAAAPAATSNAHAPSPADSETASEGQPADTVPQSEETGSQNGEPVAPTKEPPAMQGPGNGDPPGTAATPSAPAAVGGTPSGAPQ